MIATDLSPARPRVAARQEPAVLALALFLISGAGLAFEITLTRIFSLLFQYHYVFLAVSLAILGLGLGALAARFISPSHPGGDTSRLLRGCLALSLAFPLSAIVMAWLPSVESVLLHTLVALIPFVLIGLVAALAFARLPAYSGLLYGADLLGAAVAVIAVLGMLALWGAFSIVISLGVITGFAALGLSYFNSHSDLSRRYAVGSLLCLIFSAGLLAFNLSTGAIEFSPGRLTSASRDKTMINVLLDPSQSARIVYTAWDPFARVDVVETNDPATKFVFTDGGAGSFMHRFDGDPGSVAFLRGSLEYLPFAVGPVGETLVLGAGAGNDVLLALLAGSEAITAVEVNPAMVQAARRFADYNGGILDRPEVQLVIGDARTFVERSSEQYDLIYLNLVYSQAAEPASQALVENYVFTHQAFRAYLDHLRPGGHLAVVSHNALEGSRAALTALRALSDAGKPLPETLDHMALFMDPADDPTQRTSVLLFGKDPLTDQALGALSQNMVPLGLQPLFLPGGFELLFAPLRRGEDTIEEFVAADPKYDLRPTDDNRPFFFKLDPGLPPPLLQAIVTSSLLAGGLLVLSLGSGSRWRSGRSWAGFVFYVALIGVGFILLEVTLIQRFQLLFGYPVLAVSVVLGSLLLAGGLGSLLSHRWPTNSLLRRVMVAGLWIGGIALLYELTLPAVVRSLLAAPLLWRLFAAVGLTALLGFPMGIPFPSALRLAGDQSRRSVALLWGVNGAFSVLGSTLAVVVSMTWGFSWALTAGAGVYFLLAALAGMMRKL